MKELAYEKITSISKIAYEKQVGRNITNDEKYKTCEIKQMNNID